MKKQDKPATWLCGIPVDLEWAATDGGGSFNFPTRECDRAVVRIGLNFMNWYEVVTVIQHECLEFAMVELGLRWHTDRRVNDQGSSGALFVLSHDDFEEVVLAANEAACDLADILHPIWKKLRKKAGKG